MISSILTVGDKIDIKVQQSGENSGQAGERILRSVIYDIGDNDELEIAMPSENGKMILLAQGVRYEFTFYAKNSMYKCVCLVKRRYKEDGIFMMTVAPVSKFFKIQRRAFYRYECSMEVRFVPVTQEETKILTPEEMLRQHRMAFPDEAMRIGTILDLSGGGARMYTKEPVEAKTHILTNLRLMNDVVYCDSWILGRVLRIMPVQDSPSLHEMRIEFVTEDAELREDIIRYIFEEERKRRKKEQGGKVE